MGLSLMDLVSLAKAGYKPADVKELIALSEKSEPVKPEKQQSAAAANVEPTTASAEPKEANVEPTTASAEPKEATEKEAEPEKTEEKEIDYKELYEKSQEDLKKAQAVNRSADNSGKQPEYDFKDLLQTISEL